MALLIITGALPTNVRVLFDVLSERLTPPASVMLPAPDLFIAISPELTRVVNKPFNVTSLLVVRVIATVELPETTIGLLNVNGAVNFNVAAVVGVLESAPRASLFVCAPRTPVVADAPSPTLRDSVL